MKHALLSTLALVSLASAALAEDGWTTDYAAAQAKARAEGKDLLLDFTGSDW